MQQLGLTLTKAYGMHLRKATRHMGMKPLKFRAAVAPPPGFELFIAPDIDDVVDFRQMDLAIA